jgi:hypothetical protein
MKKNRIKPVLLSVFILLTAFSFAAINGKNLSYQKSSNNTTNIVFSISKSEFQISDFINDNNRIDSNTSIEQNIMSKKKRFSKRLFSTEVIS